MPTTCSTSPRSRSRCRRSAPSSSASRASSSTGAASSLIRGVPVERYGKDARVADLLGHRDAPRSAVAAERQGPPARRRHRPGPRDRRPDVAAATRSAASPFPFHSDGSDLVGLFCLDAGASGGASLVANAVSDPQRAGAHRARARGRALRAVARTTSAASRRPGTQGLVHDADLQPARRPAVRALHPALHRVVAAPRRRAAARRRRARGDGPRRRDVRRPAVPRRR